VYARNGKWLIDYGSYAQGWYQSRREAIEVATKTAVHERRELTIERDDVAVVSASPIDLQDGDLIHGPFASRSRARPHLFFAHVVA
jgi:hypothetical protein